jgi:hypothetical protein
MSPAIVNVNVTTIARPAAALRPHGFAPVLWLSAFAMLGIVVLPGLGGSKRSLRRSLGLAPLTLVLLLSSCGGGGGSTGTPPPNPSGTPAGTYTLNVKATSGTMTQTTSLTLIVQ